jgi:hypothetical protein
MTFEEQVLEIHKKHGESYSWDEAKDLMDLCAVHYKEALAYLNVPVLSQLSKLKYEATTDGFLQAELLCRLTTGEFIIAMSGLQLTWDLFATYLGEVTDRKEEEIYIAYLSRFCEIDARQFWSWAHSPSQYWREWVIFADIIEIAASNLEYLEFYGK